MNEAKQNTGQSLTAIESEIENLNSQLTRIEKTISGCLENFRRFDKPANKINPDDYFRNKPECLSPAEFDNSIQNKMVESYVKSGLVLKINELANYAKQLERQIDEFNENHIIPVGIFFERNI